jgi:Alpha-2-macroglobulin family
MNQNNGLGLSDSLQTLTVFKPFFVSLSLPYLVRRGELIYLSVQVFNYLGQKQQVTIEMSNEAQQFQFTNNTSGMKSKHDPSGMYLLNYNSLFSSFQTTIQN